MIPIYENTDWIQNLSQPPAHTQAVEAILKQVKAGGDAALRQLADKFGDPAPGPIDLDALIKQLPEGDKRALEQAADNIRNFAEKVMSSIQPFRLEQPEFHAGMHWQPVQRAACYAPAGRHPLPSTVLMTGLAARAAGVAEVCLLCPRPDPAVAYAARLAGLDPVYQLGGAQAIAAVAYGTETIRAVDMVVGPGNAYVTEAKRQLQGIIGIDMLAGPSEVTIIADAGANPRWIAADLLAQAEHDPDARVVLLCWDASLLEPVTIELHHLYQSGGYPDFLPESLRQSALLCLKSPEECAAAANQLAPEHLHLAMQNPGIIQSLLRNYGGLFVGYHSTVPFGDYGAGPNHTLPTAATARFASGLSPLTFLRAQCWLQVHPHCPELVKNTVQLAQLEGLYGHATAAQLRHPD